MRTSEKTDHIAPLFMAARLAMPTLRKKGHNPDTNSKYVKFEEMVPVVVRTFAKQNILINQSCVIVDRTVQVATRFTHVVSGEWMEMDSAVPLVGRTLKGGGKGEADPQSGGSAISYARRYGLAAAAMIVADEDDDGRAARAPEPDARPTAREPAPKPGADRNKERLAQARSYVAASFVMPFGRERNMLKVTDDKLAALYQYAMGNAITPLALDVEMVMNDRKRRTEEAASVSTQG